MLKRRTWIVSCAIALVVFTIGAVFAASRLKDLRISEKAIQGKIAEKIPFEKEKLRVKVIVEKLDFNLDNNLINLAFDVKLKGFTKELDMKATANGTLVYNSGGGTFHFRHHNLKFSELTLKGFKFSKAQEEMALAGVEAAVSWYLQNYPVYKLPDDFKGNVAKIALESVEIRDRAIIAHLSFWQLTKTVILCLVAVVMCILIVVGFAMHLGPFEALIWIP